MACKILMVILKKENEDFVSVLRAIFSDNPLASDMSKTTYIYEYITIYSEYTKVIDESQ